MIMTGLRSERKITASFYNNSLAGSAALVTTERCWHL